MRQSAEPDRTALSGGLCIVFAHARTGLPETLGEIIGYTTLLGMPLFFVLSGFVIHHNCGHLFTDLAPPETSPVHRPPRDDGSQSGRVNVAAPLRRAWLRGNAP